MQWTTTPLHPVGGISRCGWLALVNLKFETMIARIPILGRQGLLKIVGLYFAAGGLSGLAFYYVTRVNALEAVFFQPAGKFLIPTYEYWALLGVSLLIATAAGTAVTRLAGWQNPAPICWFRYLLASVLVATSVPFQVWLFYSRQQVNQEISAWNMNDFYVLAAVSGIAAILYSVGLLTRARWTSRLPISILLIALLAVWPTGAFALFLALAAYAVTGRLEIKFAFALVLAMIAGLVAGCLICRLVCVLSIWPSAVASVSALCGYQLYRTSPSNNILNQMENNCPVTALIQGGCDGSGALR